MDARARRALSIRASTGGHMEYVTLEPADLAREHICCAFSDKKCAEGYALKKDWLVAQHAHGYRFRRLDARAKVFIEYGPSEECWLPVNAANWMMLGCFWVSGQFAGKGHAKALLANVEAVAREQGRCGLLAVAGKKKFHFMSDGKWLKRQGFVPVDETAAGFELLAKDLGGMGGTPRFLPTARGARADAEKGIVVYYSNRCPFTEFHVRQSLKDACDRRGLPLTIHKITSRDEALAAPTPATIFSLFVDGNFVTTDLSVCLDSRLDKVLPR
ncbi:MAG TPA: YoaP domain-containing protein [Albidovulum sp.]|uniref:YoaP domain-containing protein n=1 Tax=Albidovulum sp. TaxID=1872424 RepID=UPI001DEFF524|nr:YoaP domain-containing protein [Paracoccaceae bacterium]HPE24278.1 YoaP domain-containing protein [Albidovulum sp.]HRV62339.1 YoaP domain-containing protein [Albidovulum sp.]